VYTWRNKSVTLSDVFWALNITLVLNIPLAIYILNYDLGTTLIITLVMGALLLLIEEMTNPRSRFSIRPFLSSARLTSSCCRADNLGKGLACREKEVEREAEKLFAQAEKKTKNQVQTLRCQGHYIVLFMELDYYEDTRIRILLPALKATLKRYNEKGEGITAQLHSYSNNGYFSGIRFEIKKSES
jgi:hypothetical protein